MRVKWKNHHSHHFPPPLWRHRRTLSSSQLRRQRRSDRVPRKTLDHRRRHSTRWKSMSSMHSSLSLIPLLSPSISPLRASSNRFLLIPIRRNSSIALSKLDPCCLMLLNSPQGNVLPSIIQSLGLSLLTSPSRYSWLLSC